MSHHLLLRALLSALLLGGVIRAQPLSGTYVVGPGGSYATLSSAIADLTTNGVSGPVTFNVTANQTGPWTIGAIGGQGATNPIVFVAIGTITLSGTQPVLTLSGCSTVVFSGFSGTFVSGTSAIVVAGTTSDCLFTACDFQAPATTSGSTGLINFTGGTNCRIEDSTFGGNWEALTSAVANTGTTLQRCRILGGGFRIMTIGGSNFVLANNFIYGPSNFGINAGIPGNPSSAANLKIWNNTVSITHPGASNQYCSLRWYTGDPGTEVLNNIFVDNFSAFSSTAFNLWCSGALRPAIMNYNCFWSNQAGYTPFWASGAASLAVWQGLGFDTNSFQSDPALIAPMAAPPDLRIQITSPCAFAGTIVPLVLTDYFGQPRTAPFSIGAHEIFPSLALSLLTAGGGVGNLNLGLTNITAGALEGFVVLSQTTTQPAGTGAVLGLVPDALSLSIISFPLTPGSPFHFPIGIVGIFPDTNLILPAGALSSLNGVTLDAVAVVLGPPTGLLGYSNLVRVTF